MVFARLTRISSVDSRYRVQIRDGTVAEITTSVRIPGSPRRGFRWPEIPYSLVVPQNILALNEGGTISVLLPCPTQDSTMSDGFYADINLGNVSKWEAVSAVDWISIDDSSFAELSDRSIYDNPPSADYSSVLKISVDPSHIGSMRTGKIIVSNGSNEYTIFIHQDGTNASIEIEETAVSVPASDGEYTIGITSNVSWVGLHSADWIHLPYPSGVGNGDLSIALEKNDTGAERAATITISGGGVSKTITVTQPSVGNAIIVS